MGGLLEIRSLSKSEVFSFPIGRRSETPSGIPASLGSNYPLRGYLRISSVE